MISPADKALYKGDRALNKHEKTLKKVFEDPVRADVKWRDIEGLLKHLKAEITEGRGSRVRVKLNDVRAVFHRPHPDPNTDKGALKSVREFLNNAGVKP